LSQNGIISNNESFSHEEKCSSELKKSISHTGKGFELFLANKALRDMKKKVSVLRNLSLILSVVCMSCAGGNVSHNGLFENDHKELKESLVGSWGTADAGPELYAFYKEGKAVKLRVRGVKTKMERFDSPDGLTFSFEYRDQSDHVVFVLGQFKSYQRQAFIAVEEVSGMKEAGSVLSLAKRGKSVVIETQEVEQDGSSRR
jgi:hypothetical protein